MDTGDVPITAPAERFIVESLEPHGMATLEGEGEGGVHLVVPRVWLPAAATEGDVLLATVADDSSGRTVRLRLDPEATEARRLEMQERHGAVPRAPGGDVDL